MNADWEVEIGGDAPVIDALWEGFVDLRREPHRARELAEVRELPSLADGLIRLNSEASPVWTAKCDVWIPEEFDRDELDAPREVAGCLRACYIDVLPRPPEKWQSLEQATAECETICTRLHGIALRCCRVDLVVRRAHISVNHKDLGITAYVTACGPGGVEALGTLARALDFFVQSVLRV